MSDEQVTRDAYDRVLGNIDGVPGVKRSRPSTVTTVMVLIGKSQTHVVQTYKTEEGFYGFLQMVDAEGRARIVIPPKAMEALYRQRDALVKASRSARAKDAWNDLSPEQRQQRVTQLHKGKKRAQGE